MIKKILVSVFGLLLVAGCEDPDNAIYDVFDGLKHGAILRTIDRVNTNFNLFDLSSTFEIVVEAQDERQGGLLQDVKVYVDYIDRQDDGVDNSKSNVLVSTFPASAFSTGPNNLPRTTISFTFSEALSALGFTDEYAGGDVINVRLELNLTDGRSFSADDATGSLQGSYFSSPYQYAAGILCIPPTPFPGDYKIDMQDSYGDGWNGASIRVTIDGTATDVFIPNGSSGSETVNVPVGTSSLVFEFVSGDWDSEVTFQIYTPSGALGFSGGPSPVVGEIALNLCNE